MNLPPPTRRRFLFDAATLAISAVVNPALTLAAGSDTQPHIAFPAAARDRIAIASYPFRQFITPTDPGDAPAGSNGSAAATGAPTSAARSATGPAMELKDFGAHVVEKFKINKIEPWSVHFKSQDAEYLAEMRAAFEHAGVSVVNIAVDGDHSVYAADAAERARAIAESKSWIDVAVAIGSPSVRTHLAEAKDSGPDARRASECLRQVAEYGAAKNVVVNLENDNPVTEDAFFVARLAATVHSPWLHGLPDFANSLAAMSERQAYDAIDAMFSQAYNICHVKALEVNSDGEKYRVDMKRTFGILKHYNFKGFCSMEFDSPGDPYAGTAELIKQTLQYLG